MTDLDGAFLCSRGRPVTDEDLAIVADFARFLRGVATEKETPMKQVNVFQSQTEGQWVVRADGFATQEDAINWARPAAHKIGCDITTHGEDGQIREKDSHGNDPKEIKG